MRERFPYLKTQWIKLTYTMTLSSLFCIYCYIFEEGMDF